MLIFSSLFVFATLACTNAQTFNMGNCDRNMKTVENFNATAFEGDWYEITRSYHVIESSTKCNVFPYRPGVNGHDFEVKNTHVTKDGQLNSIRFDVNAVNMSRGILKFTPGFINDEQIISVVATDYNTYWIAYSCFDAHQGRLEYSWILSKFKHPSEEIIKLGEQILKSRNVNLKMQRVKQDC